MATRAQIVAWQSEGESAGVPFSISAWAASAAGLIDAQHWLDWARDPILPMTPGVAPELAWMPALARRRVGPLGRHALHVANECTRGTEALPIVFASRYGDAERSLDLLGTLVAGEPVSPTAFGLSVHNAVAAQFSITRSQRSPSVSIAAGAASAAAGIFEAAAMLADGATEVVLVCYDAPLPGDYAVFSDEPPALWAWAWRMTPPRTDQPCFSLRTAPGAGPDTVSGLPFGLELLRLALNESGAPVRRRIDGVTWTLEPSRG